MTTSLKSDFYLLRGYLKSLLGVYFFMIVIAFIQKNTFLANFYPAFLAIYMPYTLFSLGQQSGWETMLLSTQFPEKGLSAGDMPCASLSISGCCSSALALHP